MTAWSAGVGTAPGIGCWPCPDQVGCGRRAGVGGQCRLQQRAGPPARRRGPQAAGADRRQRGQVGDQTEALGRSRGGLTTKIHLGCDGRGRPLGVVLTPGQRHDSTQLEPVLDAIAVPGPSGRGRPRKRPDHLVGDKAYSYPTCRRLLRRRGIGHTIPQRSDQRARRAGRPGRPLAFDRERYRVAMWWSGASTGSSSSARWRPASRSGRSTTGPWL